MNSPIFATGSKRVVGQPGQGADLSVTSVPALPGVLECHSGARVVGSTGIVVPVVSSPDGVTQIGSPKKEIKRPRE